MTAIKVRGCPPYDGDYEIDLGQELTSREWGWVKRLAGYLPLDVTDNAYGDPELLCVLAAIAMRRAGRIEAGEVAVVYERLQDVPFSEALTIANDEPAEDQTDPPTPRSSNGSTAISGSASKANSARSARRPRPIGTRASDTSASGRLTSAS